MTAHVGDPDVFVRSLATRGALGGLSAAVEDAWDLMDRAGFDPVLVETVGVGQAEVDVADAADTTVVVLAPGAGDEIQAMKAGLVEAADVLVVNQADRAGARRLVAALEAALDLRTGGRKPLVLATTATTGEGVDALGAWLDARQGPEAAPTIADRRLGRARRRVQAAVDRHRARTFWASRADALEAAARDVADGRLGAAAAARRLIEEDA
jgi:LAO/AO transport system kinase